MQTRTEILAPDGPGIARAAAILRAQGLVAFPTETVYGLGAHARASEGVARIYRAKGRPAHNPLIVHVADIAAARELALFPPAAEALARAFWPGPLTLVLPARKGGGLAPALMAGLGTVALRVPAHPVAQALIAAAGLPIAAPSANPSGRISPTQADHVLADLDGRIEAVIDGGPCTVGVESTIVGWDAAGPVLLRHGGVTAEAIEAVLGAALGAGGDSDRPTAPGQLASHYAPHARVRLGATAPAPGEVWIGFGPGTADAPLSLSPAGDPAEAAARLFDVLRAADRLAGPGGRIAVAPVPEAGLGRAVNDRLRRAAAPRPSGDA
jgi:L-threonylcarbamoyladenylate synthase